MKALVVADTHGNLMQRHLKEKIGTEIPSIIFFLGDVFACDIEAVRYYFEEVLQTKLPYACGIVGNHDDPNILKDNDIVDIHRKVIDFKRIKIGGYGGSVRYKETDYYLLHTQDECEEELKTLPPCDIFLCHDKPIFKKEKSPEELPTKQSFFDKLFRKSKTITCGESENKKSQDIAHSGLTGLGTYIDRIYPQIVLHGHIHTPSKTLYKCTQVQSCYFLEWIVID